MSRSGSDGVGDTSDNAHVPLLKVPAGPSGVELVHSRLIEALAGGPPCIPVPETSRYFSQEFISGIERAINPARSLQDSTVAVLTTSGSTGNPRGVEFSAGTLNSLNHHMNSGAVTGHRIDAPPQWIAAIPVTSVGGFNVVVRAIAAGLPPLALSSVGGASPFSIEETIQSIASVKNLPVMISLVPAQVRRLLGTAEGTQALQQCSLVLVGGSATPVSDQIRMRDENINVAFTYGMTETTGGCVFNGTPAPGVGIEVDPDTSAITISGEIIATGYRPTTPTEPFVPFNSSFTTKDIGALDMEGTLNVLGRADDIVMINGVNISLNAITEIINSHELVTDCFVLPDLVALIVTSSPEVDSIIDELRKAIANSLGSIAVPQFRPVSALPQLPNGKHDRQEIARLYG
jgi:o-succinylbenzoate---CoA ligase